jgi:DNA-directed RNA polymerase specialized sigma24 family protein
MPIAEHRWYADDAKRLEVIVWFLERRVSRSRRKESGTLKERLDRAVARLQRRGRGRDYDDIEKILWVRASYGTYSEMAERSGLTIGTVKQTVRRLDRVAYQLFSSES